MARYDLKLSKAEFYELTLREMKALMRRKEYERSLDEFMAAQIAAAVINFSTVHPKRQIEPRELMPSEMSKRNEHGGDDLADQVRRTFAVLQKAHEDRNGSTA